MINCLFCKISGKEIPAKIRFENDYLLAFDDINPKAKIHILLIPKKHIESAATLDDSDRELMGKMVIVARNIAKEAGILDAFRLVTNSGENAGQSVEHIHFHILGGNRLGDIA